MTSVWLIESGEYSDYSVDGVFSSSENARAFIEASGGVERTNHYEEKRNYTVREVPLDPCVRLVKKGYRAYFVRMDKNGNAFEIREPIGVPEENDEGGYCTERTDTRGHIFANVWAKDHAHAAKIMNERRVQMIASGTWGKT